MAELHELVLGRDVVPTPAAATCPVAVDGLDKTYQLPFSLINKSFVGLGNVLNTKCNFSASADPTTSDDSVAGYSVGSLWLHGSAAWICAGASTGTAVWVSLTSGVVTDIDGGDVNGD